MRTPSNVCDHRSVTLRVVLVDDSEPFLGSARALLESEGVVVVGVATTPAEALGRVRDLRPDVVIVDLHLGSASGLDLVGRLSAEGGPAPAVVLVSSIAREDLAELAGGAPVRGLLTKSDLSAAALESIVAGA
jgi:DNA-binding NarL/FixJ family response regulator